mmetsp:Transcript_16832/g.36583  ORF Transcript_16832/g.36583 Transcript_16832/m.36583 type:complete len:89 (+) Transcript_16832:28-294(+)
MHTLALASAVVPDSPNKGWKRGVLKSRDGRRLCRNAKASKTPQMKESSVDAKRVKLDEVTPIPAKLLAQVIDEASETSSGNCGVFGAK